VLDGMGLTYTDQEADAQIVGILACSVRQKAIDKVYHKIRHWNQEKDKRNLLTFVSGCMLPEDKERFLKLFDLVFHMGELTELPHMIQQYGVVTPVLQNVMTESDADLKEDGLVAINTEALQPVSAKPEDNIHDFWQVKPMYNSTFEAFIPIQNGCDKYCTFCAVPYTRGREVSRPSADILAELQQLVQQGYKSITLLGQNVNSYGLDKKGGEISFAQLLKDIGEFGLQSGQAFWVYFTSPHPRDMTEEVVEVIAQYPCLAKQIHLPLQSGDDKVLIRMNRKYSLEQYRTIVNHIRRHLPTATLFTDIIVGFTGETDKQFDNTAKAMHEFKFNMAYIARYSPRPGAASARWEDDVSPQLKKTRLHQLSEVLTQHTRIYNQRLIGSTLRILVTGKDRKKGYLTGHTEGRIIVRFPSEDDSLVGQFVDIEVRRAAALSLEGECVGLPISNAVSS
jgi:tRNA-2-methylthio-N6-dimethylallyladenosine synthase